jgi:hypothetical protein
LIKDEDPPPKPQFSPVVRPQFMPLFKSQPPPIPIIKIKREPVYYDEAVPNVQVEELQAQLKEEREEKRKLHIKLQKKIKKNKELKVSRLMLH